MRGRFREGTAAVMRKCAASATGAGWGDQPAAHHLEAAPEQPQQAVPHSLSRSLALVAAEMRLRSHLFCCVRVWARRRGYKVPSTQVWQCAKMLCRGWGRPQTGKVQANRSGEIVAPSGCKTVLAFLIPSTKQHQHNTPRPLTITSATKLHARCCCRCCAF